MTRTQLIEILKRTTGVKESKKGFDVADGHEIALYVGQIGQSTMISDVRHLSAEAEHLEATLGDRRTMFMPYEIVHMLAARVPRDSTDRRTGFA
ncbi:MAG: hypothetical protein IPK60_01440 [Sandaracinaceae bacterium]|nr:hypothetical protein [Sandaracinaceae bacterium]